MLGQGSPWLGVFLTFHFWREKLSAKYLFPLVIAAISALLLLVL